MALVQTFLAHFITSNLNSPNKIRFKKRNFLRYRNNGFYVFECFIRLYLHRIFWLVLPSGHASPLIMSVIILVSKPPQLQVELYRNSGWARAGLGEKHKSTNVYHESTNVPGTMSRPRQEVSLTQSTIKNLK